MSHLFLAQALRNVPHLTVTWPNQQHALIPRRSGLFNRGHQVKDQSAVKPKSGPQHIQSGDNPMASQVRTSMDLPASSWEVEVNNADATVASRSSSGSEGLSCLSDDPPTTTDGRTVVESGCKTDSRDALVTVPDAILSEQPLPTDSDSSDAPPKPKDATPEQGHRDVVFGTSVVLSQSSNPLEWSETVSNSLVHSKTEALASSPV